MRVTFRSVENLDAGVKSGGDDNDKIQPYVSTFE